jgi:DNA-binding response OmpR family regulator
MMHLLLVEDDLGLQDILGEALTDTGYDVVVASNGTQGLAELDARATQFEKIIADIELGAGPDGWDIGRRAREFVADMPVVYISGNCAGEWPSKSVANSVFIAKPFTMARMILTLTTSLVTAGGWDPVEEVSIGHQAGRIPLSPAGYRVGMRVPCRSTGIFAGGLWHRFA